MAIKKLIDSLIHSPSIFVLIFFLCNQLRYVESIEVDRSIRARPYLYFIQKFGFDEGGTLDFKFVNIEPKSAIPQVLFYLCTEEQWKDVVSFLETKGNNYKLCQANYSSISNFPQCEISGQPFLTPFGNSPNMVLQDHTIRQRALYRLYLVNCVDITGTGKTVDARLKYTLMNPGRQELSLGDGPLPQVYAVIFASWGWIACGWLLFLCMYPPWRTRSVTALHMIFEVVIISKLAVTFVSFIYWQVCSNTGHCYDWLQYINSFMFAISESFFFCLLLLIAKGYKITRWTLPTAELRRIAVALILLLSTLLFFSLYNDSYYFLSLLIMYFFMLPKILTAITRNTRTISTQIFFITHLNQAQNPTWNLQVLKSKLRVFQGIRIISIAYLVMILAVFGVRLVVVWYLNWAIVGVNELMILLVVFSVGVVLKPNELVFSRDTIGDNSNALIALVNLMERGELSEQDFLDEDGGAIGGENGVDFGNGQVNDFSEIVVFQYPSAWTNGKDEKAGGKGKDVSEEDTSVQSESGIQQQLQEWQGVAAYPLAVGALEKWEPGTTDQEEDQEGMEGEASGEKKKKKKEKKKETKKKGKGRSRNKNSNKRVQKNKKEREAIELDDVSSNSSSGSTASATLDDEIDLERGGHDEDDESGSLLRRT